ncbi:hypothetical protein STVA_18780 [Allostella vacuolata]|nr:hypothetical protein STVA_18780 [Stella vacuolata]
MRRPAWAVRTALGLAAACAVATSFPGGARTEERTQPVQVQPDRSLASVRLQVELTSRATSRAFAPGESPTLLVGDEVVVCFRATRSGFVTLWSIDASGAHAVVYPNSLSHPAGARSAPVQPDQRTCIGDDERFRLQVAEPAGEAKIYLHWTEAEGQQLGAEDYPVIAGSGVALSREFRAPYASSMLGYRVGAR